METVYGVDAAYSLCFVPWAQIASYSGTLRKGENAVKGDVFTQYYQ